VSADDDHAGLEYEDTRVDCAPTGLDCADTHIDCIDLPPLRLSALVACDYYGRVSRRRQGRP
jgi:hypothetical protein